MQNNTAPYRADEVGSLLRTAARQGRARQVREGPDRPPPSSQEVEDEEIKKVIRKQEEVGLQLATDGEFRRSWWHFDFFWKLTGCERVVLDHGIQFHGVQTKPESLRVTAKLDFPADHPMLGHFKFLKANTKVTPKMTIPSPSVMHFRGGRNAISKEAYPDMEGYFEDLAKVYGKAIKAFYDAGCRYLQLDDTVWAYLCSEKQMEQARKRGEDADKLPAIYAKVINTALKSKPADMVITTHVCRGNFRSTWISEGGYEPVAEVLLGRHRLRRLFPGIRHRARRRARAAALPAQGQEAGGGRPRHLQERHAREDRRHQAPARGGLQVRADRAAVPLAPVRLCLHRGGQRADRGPAMGQAQDDRRYLQGSVEMTIPSPHSDAGWGDV